MNEIINYEEKALSLFTDEDIEKLRKFNELEAQVKMIKKQRDEALKEIFRNSEQKSFENDQIKIMYVKSKPRRTVDTEKMKSEGIYEFYLKEGEPTESIRIEVKYE
ncbi:MAG: hypothetical protein IJF87_05845 [Erysipelotrichaceae bacterium]|nr:hypothetical protein [Erysipelotrichaceae bacterium]